MSLFEARVARQATQTLRRDAALGPWVERIGPLELEPRDFTTPFEALVRSITYQQLSGKAAGTIYGRLIEAFGRDGLPNPMQLARAQEDELRAVGLSRSKAGYIQGLATAQLDGELPSASQLAELPDDEVVASLTRFKGVGPWTVQMLLIFWLGRPDVLPTADLGVQKGAALVLGRDAALTAKELAEAGERWAPWRSAASWYLWRSLDQPAQI